MNRSGTFISAYILCAVIVLSMGPSHLGAQSNRDLMISGHPLGYWISQAIPSERTESLEQIIKSLTAAVATEDPAAKVAASDALGTLGVSAMPALPVLLDQLSHELGWVRESAAGAVAAMGKEAVPAVLDLFKRQVGAPSVRAAFLLGVIGADARPAIPSLVSAMKDADPVMQARYADILNQIDPEHFAGNTTSSALQAGRVKLDDNDWDADMSSGAGDWPQYHGPGRDSVCSERGLLQSWPEGGPPLLWTLEGLGQGYSSIAIAQGRIFTMGDRATDSGDAAQYVLAFDLRTRAELWAAHVGQAFTDGPRCTPTVAGDLVYALGTEGDLLCLEAASGRIRWRKSLARDLDGKMMSGWKYSESPLVDGNQVICTPGGKDTALVALDRQTGELLWKCALPAMGDKGSDGAAYSSAVVAEMHGVRQVIQMVGRGVVGIEAATGKLLWTYNRIACNVANVTTPVVRGNYVFVTNAYNTGSALLEINHQGDGFVADELYFLGAQDFQNHHGGIVLVDGFIYGGSGTNAGHPTCIDLATGKICWSERSPSRGSASVIYADSHIIFRYDRGEVLLLEATPEAMRIKGRFTAVQGEGAAWAHPVIYLGRLYLRHGDLLGCYDLRAVE